jgi:hypothetical protein
MNVFCCADLLIYLSEFLEDKYSFRLFNTNKTFQSIIKKYPNRYTIKKTVFNYELYFLYKYKIINYRQHTYDINYYHYIYDNNTIQNFIIGNNFKGNLEKYPNNIKKFSFNDTVNRSLINLPHSITELSLCWVFNQYICSSNLPKSLKILNIYSREFNKPLDDLPNTITHLTLGSKFNQSLNYLPKSLTYLNLRECNNLDIISFDHLPSNLIKLILPECFDGPIENLPSKLEYIEFGIWFNHSIENLPNSITNIELSSLSFDKKIPDFPKLKKLRLNNFYNLPLNFTNNIEIQID